MMGEPYLFKPEVTWKSDPAVEAARQLPGWREFHSACAKRLLFFDHIEKHGRQFVSIAVVGSGAAQKVAEERGKTPVEALTAAYRAARIPVEDAERWLALISRGPDALPSLEDILGGEDEPDMEDILG